ncbi:uncharacterized protein LOC111893711 [Lactuca sativa]|uniref:Uncharacterized protein n=1 Tax=Lactuca sativa TaxID=4236 RepID=A0A9R1VXX8_LACSA|nr:uncharacterized protein LOC111893711 [Lactuca sativa]XP_052626616.1 uncharacterized protein LOC111893711 [Lactuca sativa]XP_052626617.1 uncharacterized protein LOC111893711 [Lactuca sativa]KAJ0214666.1 hypothetical protein LSAT_V11C400222130 [Lactuca sativa]
MGAKVESKTYFPSSMIDLNNGFHNDIWNPYHDDKTHKISGPTNSQHYNYFLTTQTIDGYAKEQIRQTILKHESIFKHQLQELHRLYKRQQDLMNLTKETRIFASSFPHLGSTFRPFNSINGKSLGVPERRVIDLQQSTDEQEIGIFQNLTQKKPFNLADLNKPIIDCTSSAKKTLFGVEINSVHQNHWLGSFDSGNSRSMTTSEWQNRNKHEQSLPLWMTKGKESTVHHINLNSLQNHSHQFFNKADVASDDHETREFKKVKLDDSRTITMILGVPIIDTKLESNVKHDIDLNMSLDEEDAPPPAPETPPSPENPSAMDSDLELVNIAAEAIISISTFHPPEIPEKPVESLMWFADVITNDLELEKSFVEKSEEMDYFEYMTLKLQDSKENHDDFYKPVIMEDKKEEENNSLSLKRTPRKGQGKRGKQKKDFQKDILPNIVSLSRREVTEDLQIFEDAFSGTGVFWQSSLSKRKGGGRSGRGRRRSVAAEPLCRPQPPPEQCRELALEKSLGGWGRRTRRLPRQRCSNGGSHYRSLALKC